MTQLPTIQVAVFAAHPDDAEIFCGATVAKLAALGHQVAIIDLTRGELASQGTPEQRMLEAQAASTSLGIALRENLALPDGRLNEMSPDQLEICVAIIRRLRPELLVIPYWEDRHPDHVQAARLLQRAVFFAGLKSFVPASGAPHHPRQVLYYQLRTSFTPSFVVDVTEAYDTKLNAIRCYKSQVERDASAGVKTLISSPLSLSSIVARDEHYGAMIGVKYAEPFLSTTAIAVGDPVSFFRANSVSEPLASPHR